MKKRWLFLPRIEFARFAAIDFFPPRPTSLEGCQTICLGTKSRTIGDALMLSTLPAKLRIKYPSIRVYAYPRGFNPAVFCANPNVTGPSYLPQRVYGDDINWGEGHLIQLKERFFDLPVSEKPKPEIHLLDSERRWAKQQAKSGTDGDARPICAIHPWGGTVKSVATRHFWGSLVQRWSHSYRFWQMGVRGHEHVPGCEKYLFLPRGYRHARKVFAAISEAGLFIGVNSGPMHVARAFDVTSLILTVEGELETVFRMRHESPYFLYQNWRHSFLYEDNTHIDAASLSEDLLLARVDSYLEEHHPSARAGP